MGALLVVESDPVSDHPSGVYLALKSTAVHALLFQCPDHAFDHPVLLRAVRGDELLFQAVAAHQPCVVAIGEYQTAV